ncbi:MAG: hypothetical protein LBG73_00595, partial [Spirochaetaceae bacterium]|nr:hypothetical protein [Spirochaetaceae bacterium]
DGNKRVALASSLVFLDINGYAFNCNDEVLYTEIMEVAKGEINKEALINFYEKYSKEIFYGCHRKDAFYQKIQGGYIA